ncbi:unnamed protein product, partial [Closterium sp. NIES-65]
EQPNWNKCSILPFNIPHQQISHAGPIPNPSPLIVFSLSRMGNPLVVSKKNCLSSPSNSASDISSPPQSLVFVASPELKFSVNSLLPVSPVADVSSLPLPKRFLWTGGRSSSLFNVLWDPCLQEIGLSLSPLLPPLLLNYCRFALHSQAIWW